MIHRKQKGSLSQCILSIDRDRKKVRAKLNLVPIIIPDISHRYLSVDTYLILEAIQ